MSYTDQQLTVFFWLYVFLAIGLVIGFIVVLYAILKRLQGE